MNRYKIYKELIDKINALPKGYEKDKIKSGFFLVFEEKKKYIFFKDLEEIEYAKEIFKLLTCKKMAIGEVNTIYYSLPKKKEDYQIKYGKLGEETDLKKKLLLEEHVKLVEVFNLLNILRVSYNNEKITFYLKVSLTILSIFSTLFGMPYLLLRLIEII